MSIIYIFKSAIGITMNYNTINGIDIAIPKKEDLTREGFIPTALYILSVADVDPTKFNGSFLVRLYAASNNPTLSEVYDATYQIQFFLLYFNKKGEASNNPIDAALQT
jgi:hypothetical protein